jgi:RHS repeat-associated protein
LYDAWGKVKKLPVDEVEQPIRLQGQYFDDETGLAYNRFRYYDPQIGAFVSQDPLGLVAGENVYAFAANIQGYIDPLGLCKENLPPYNNFQEFRKDFSSEHNITRRNARVMWQEYQNNPDKFFTRKKVVGVLKSEGRIPYTPEEKVRQTLYKAGDVYLKTQGNSIPAKFVQFGTETIKGYVLPTDPNIPNVYNTNSGNLGGITGTILSKIFPFKLF